MVKTLYGWDKKIPTQRLWHHKSCGQCGNIPGYPASLLWLMNRMDVEYLDETDQTSCTAWNYHGSGIGNLESLAAVFLRNFHQAYVAAKAQGLPEAYYYPLVHCGTSFGNYKEVRAYLIRSAKLRESVKKILGKLGRLVDGKLLIPEEVVHYSEWLHVMRDRIAAMRELDCSQVRATIHPACHVYKMVPEDAIYDDNILGGNRLAVSTGIMQALGAQVIDYSTWYDCCGFGFRHIISEREFTRSFAIDRKIRVAVEEARADVMIGHDTGCITTLDKNQWISKSGAQARGTGGARRLPVRRARLRRASVQDRAVALARLAHRDADGEDRHRLGGEEGRVRRLPRGDQDRQAGEPLRPAPHDHLRAGLRADQKRHQGRAMTKPILVVGAGPSGLAAAHALASVGQRVVLVEKESTPRRRADPLGLRRSSCLRASGRRTPSAAWCRGSKEISSLPFTRSTRVEEFAGDAGQFHGAGCRTARSIEAGAAILCTGFTHFDSVNKPEWGFGTFPDVVTTTQVEQMISSGRGIRCPSDGRKPQRVAILLCVGSRDRQIGREWCSKICCTVSCNIAMEIREELPDCHVYIYYMDIRTYGLNETYYWKSQEEFKVKYIKARIAEVTSDGQKLIVKGEDTLVKRPITIPFDMVVHAIGMDPNVDNKSIAGVFGVNLQEHGHVARGSYGASGETSRAGVFVAGAATGPETIDDSIAQGNAAAMAAFALVSPKSAVAA